MLKLRYGESYPEECVLLLGGFDGLHKGHKTLLSEAKKTGLPVGITTILGGKAGGEAFTIEEREYLFEQAGISFAVEINFTEQIRNVSAEEFLQTLKDCFRVKAVFCGEDFRFGAFAKGTPELAESVLNCPVTALPLYSEQGEKIATSQIKRLLGEGDLERVNELLGGEGYFLQGVVQSGRKVGRTYGFPTLNLSLSTQKFPLKEGVYGGLAQTSHGIYPTIINMGACPTFGVEEKKVEAYLEGFSGDLYGETVRIFPKKFYRTIEKFASAEELKTQLQKDILRLKEDSYD